MRAASRRHGFVRAAGRCNRSSNPTGPRAGLDLKDTTPRTDEKFQERKLSLGPYGASGQVPIFILPDGTSMCQSRAILKYLGHVVSYGGSPRAARAATGRVVGAAALSSPRRRAAAV